MKCGKIINIASLKGQLGSERQANYAAFRAGIIGFSKSLEKEEICVNVIEPGYIKTDLNSTNIRKSYFQEHLMKMFWKCFNRMIWHIEINIKVEIIQKKFIHGKKNLSKECYLTHVLKKQDKILRMKKSVERQL